MGHTTYNLDLSAVHGLHTPDLEKNGQEPLVDRSLPAGSAPGFRAACGQWTEPIFLLYLKIRAALSEWFAVLLKT